MISVTLIANTMRPYAFAAQALNEAGYLRQFLTVPMLRPAPLVRVGGRLARRSLPENLRDIPMSRMWAAAGLAWGISDVAQLLGSQPLYDLQNRCWSAEAWVRMRASDVLHHSSGIGLLAGRRAYGSGSFVICDVKAAHPRALCVAGQRSLRDFGVVRSPGPPVHVPCRRESIEYDRADLLLCNSEYTRSTFVEAGFDPASVKSVALGCDLNLFTALANADETGALFTIMFAGRFDLLKGGFTLLQAVRRLPSTCKLVIAGVVDPVLEPALRNLRCEVERLGHISQTELAHHYRRASVLVVPSYSDGWGMVVLEGMATGCPVIVSDQCGAATVVEDGRNGFSFRAGDSGELEICLRRLMEADRSRFRLAALHTASEWSWARYGERLLKLYRDLKL